MRTSTVLCTALTILSFVNFASAAMTLQFDQSNYSVTPGGMFSVDVLLDPVPDVGLFSMGVKIKYDGTHVRVDSLDDIILPDAINSSGAGFPPEKEIVNSTGDSFAGAAGGIVQFQGYTDPLLLTISFTDLTPPSNVPTSYDLHLDFFFDSYANFVDFEGKGLDSEITEFGTARVNVEGSPAVIPAPASLILGIFGSSIVVGIRKLKGKLLFSD